MLSQEERKNLFDLLQSNDVTNIEVALQIGEGTQTHLYQDEFEKLWDFLKKLDYPQLSQKKLSVAEKIWELMQIETLKLELKESTIIPDGICFMKNLKSLSLKAYGEVYLPQTMTWLEELKSLEMHLFNSDVLPELIFKLEHLEELSLAFSLMKEIPTTIFNLQNLKILNLTYCMQLETLPYEVFSLPQLEKLYVAFTSLEEVSPSIGFSNLQTFSFDSQVDAQLFADPEFGQKLLKYSREEENTLFGKKFHEHLTDYKSQKKIQNIPTEIKNKGIAAIKNYFRYGS